MALLQHEPADAFNDGTPHHSLTYPIWTLLEDCGVDTDRLGDSAWRRLDDLLQACAPITIVRGE